jgi:hypothetical protein
MPQLGASEASQDHNRDKNQTIAEALLHCMVCRYPHCWPLMRAEATQHELCHEHEVKGSLQAMYNHGGSTQQPPQRAGSLKLEHEGHNAHSTTWLEGQEWALRRDSRLKLCCRWSDM